MIAKLIGRIETPDTKSGSLAAVVNPKNTGGAQPHDLTVPGNWAWNASHLRNRVLAPIAFTRSLISKSHDAVALKQAKISRNVRPVMRLS
jgi:hypothetical protein